MIKILIAVPTFENILPDTFKSIYNLNKTDDMQVDFDFVRGYHCSRARNLIAKKAIKNEYDYVLMVDSDMIIPPHTLTSMLDNPKELCLGCYPRKNTGKGEFEIFKLGFKDYVNRYNYGEIVNLNTKIEVKGGGFGCALIKVDLFNKLKNPFFKYVEYDSGAVLSEDNYFCSQVSKAGYKIYADTNVMCGHSVRGFQ